MGTPTMACGHSYQSSQPMPLTNPRILPRCSSVSMAHHLSSIPCQTMDSDPQTLWPCRNIIITIDSLPMQRCAPRGVME